MNNFFGIATAVSVVLSILSVPASHAAPSIVFPPSESFYDSPTDSSLSTAATREGRFHAYDFAGDDNLEFGNIYVDGVFVDSLVEAGGFGINAFIDGENRTFLSGDFGASASACPNLNIEGGIGSGACSLDGVLTGFGSGEFDFMGTLTGGSLAGAGLPFDAYSTVGISIPGVIMADYDFTKDSYYNNWINITIVGITPVPIPAAFYLFGVGLAVLATTVHRRKMAW